MNLERIAGGFAADLPDCRIRVEALRHDILRVRITRTGDAPSEDASWAVLEPARRARVAVESQPDGFSTPAVRVRIADGRLQVVRADGSPILADDGPSPVAFDGAGFRLTKALPEETHIFGLGEKAGPLDRRRRAFSMWNTDAYKYQESTDPLYKTVPFFIGLDHGRAHGVFLDNTWRSHFEFGVLDPARLSFGAAGGPIDYYLMAGPEPKAVCAAYAWLTGPAALPPLWAFGFQQSRFSYMSAAEARTVAARMRENRIPCDVLWFDIDVLDRHRPFTINPESFAGFGELVRELRDQGLRSVVITDLHVPVLPGQGYAPYDSGSAGEHFVHDASGTLFTGVVWPGDCHFPDFTRAATRRWWGGLFRDPVFDGVAGIWNDMNEPSVFRTATRTMPMDVVHRIEEPGFAARDASHAEIHNVFGMQNARATHDGLLEIRPDERPFVMSRASYAGGHRTSVVWTGDNSASWDHQRMSTPMLLSLGLGGFAFAGCDLGGFSGSPPPELLTRWLQLGMFNPISRDHSDKGTRAQEPWVDGEPHTTIRRRAIEERYRLLPYIYSLAEEASRTGVPMMRPLFLEFPDAAGGYALDLETPSQFLWGPAMLVAAAPFEEMVDKQLVILPPGDWYDYWTGKRLAGLKPAELTGGSGATIAFGDDPALAPRQLWLERRLDGLPVFVRAGQIIPRQPLVQHTGQVPDGPLELLVYPDDEGNASGTLYVDDGHSFAYRRGEFLRLALRCRRQGGRLAVETEIVEGNYSPWWRTIEVKIQGVAAPP